MKKLIIIATLLTASFSLQAKGGGDANRPLKNSMAGFASESIEHSMRLLYRTNSSVQNQVIGASVELHSETDSTVAIELTGGNVITYSCIRFDDWSNSGTVLKKEVVCRK